VKKVLSIIMVMSIVAIFFSAIPVTAEANQGAYGNVYAIVGNDDHEVFVSGAIVRAYIGGSLVGQATASACGYYTIDLPATALCHLVVENLTYSTRKITSGGGCGDADITDHFAGDAWVTIISNAWNHEDIETY
jgi:hypothetical protein